MKEVLIFGGPNLPDGTHTWYEDARTGANVTARPGDRVPAERIKAGEGNGPEDYVRRGQATLADASAAEWPIELEKGDS